MTPAIADAGCRFRQDPLVSVIVPSFNQGRFLRSTLRSILAQEYRPLEVLVIDGGSVDESVATLQQMAERHPELRWRSEADDGPADAVNKGLAMASGEIAAIQSSDDLYLPGAVQAAVDAFRVHPDASIVYGDVSVIDERGAPRRSRRLPTYTLRRFLCGSTYIFQSSAFFRPQLARDVGGWDPGCFVADVDLWLRMVYRAPAVKIDVVLSAYRCHEAQRNTQTEAIWRGWWEMIERSDDVRRSPLRHRLAADAGRRLLAQYHYPGPDPLRLAQMWRALLTYPPSVLAVEDPRLLFPNADRLRRWRDHLVDRLRTAPP